jgi:hypothetical protein
MGNSDIEVAENPTFQESGLWKELRTLLPEQEELLLSHDTAVRRARGWANRHKSLVVIRTAPLAIMRQSVLNQRYTLATKMVAAQNPKPTT